MHGFEVGGWGRQPSGMYAGLRGGGGRGEGAQHVSRWMRRENTPWEYEGGQPLCICAAVPLLYPNPSPSPQVRLVLEYCDEGCLRDALDQGAFMMTSGLNYKAILVGQGGVLSVLSCHSIPPDIRSHTWSHTWSYDIRSHAWSHLVT